MMKNNTVLFFCILNTTILLLLAGNLHSQVKLGDNLGNHKAMKDLLMNGKNINNIQVVNAENVAIGNVTAVTNQSVALQVNGSNKAILIPRVADLFNGSSPSIPSANAVEGMIVYDLQTHRFYVRNNSAWISYGTLTLAPAQVFIGDATSNARGVTVSGDVTFNNSGLTTIGASRISSAMLADQSVISSKIAPGPANSYLWTNAAGNAAEWVSTVNDFVDIYNRQDNIKGLKTFASDTGFVAAGTFGANISPAVTPGARLFWYPKKAAFITGNVLTANLVDTRIGNYSVAMGNGASASGEGSIATGTATISGAYTAAFGVVSSSASNYSVINGQGTLTGDYTTAFGNSQTGSGPYTVALAQGFSSNGGVAIGTQTNAGYNGSMALGNYNGTDVNVGALVMNDVSSTVDRFRSTAANQFRARFAGGYRFYTNAALSAGVFLAAGGSSWMMISDRRKKENFARVQHEMFLSKIDTMALGSWNYIGQDPKRFRHYGPMAQDFFQAFGRDNYGSIGNDTTINSGDIDGVAMIAVQGLIKRLSTLKKNNERLEQQNIAVIKNLEEEQNAFQLAMVQLIEDAENIEKATRVKLAEIQEAEQIDKEKLALQNKVAEQKRMNQEAQVVSWYNKAEKLIWKTAERVKNR